MANGQAEGANMPQHFVVELVTDEGKRYALCQTLTVVAAGSASLPAAAMEEFISQNTLRAVAVPDSGASGAHPVAAHWTQLALDMQSGEDSV
jgi:hypothetical protein